MDQSIQQSVMRRIHILPTVVVSVGSSAYQQWKSVSDKHEM